VEGKLPEPPHTAADGFCQALTGTESSGMQELSPDRAVLPAAGRAAATATGPSPGAPARARVRWSRADIDAREIAAIFAGGALGTLARTVLADAFPQSPTAWPWPTFAVNIVAAFGLGYFVTRLTERLPLSSYRRPLLGTGLCGGLSTFSTMQVEILKMLDAHAWALTAGYAAASVAGGYAAIQLATAMVRRVRVQVRR
jgi:fluoride exporter